MARWFVLLMIAEYAIAAGLYLVEKDFPRATYFAGAIVVTAAVLWIK